MNPLDRIIQYFDLTDVSLPKGRPTKRLEDARRSKLFLILPQYLALVLGILVQPYLAAYQQTGNWNIDGVLGRLLFSIIVGVIILPGIYKNTFDPDKPIAIQLCLLFVAGMGWESLMNTAISAV